MKIVLIDDEADFCYFVKLNLELTGKFDVLTSTNGEEGFILAAKEQPDLVILDVVMPGMSGGQVADRMQRSHKVGHIPILFITAIASRDQVQSNEGLIGGRQFIAKPVTPQELVSKIASLGFNVA
jgi:DNA-binding response OmpR family regulator